MVNGMRVHVRIMGVLKNAAGGNEFFLDLEPNSDVKTVLYEISKNNQGFLDVLWDPVTDSPVPNALILVNGVEINNLEGIDTRMDKDSELVLLSVTHGG